MTEILAIKQLQGDESGIYKILGKLHEASVTATTNSVYRLKELLGTLREDLIVTIEYDYVDATYRDGVRRNSPLVNSRILRAQIPRPKTGVVFRDIRGNAPVLLPTATAIKRPDIQPDFSRYVY